MWVFDPFSGTFKFVEMPAETGSIVDGNLDFGTATSDVTLDTGLRTNDTSTIDSGNRII